MQTVIKFTAVPSGIVLEGERRFLKVSVFVTPEFWAEPNDPVDVPVSSTVFANWPERLSNTLFRVYFQGGRSDYIAEVGILSPLSHEPWASSLGTLRAEIMRRGTAALAVPMVSFDAAAAADFLTKLYAETLRPPIGPEAADASQPYQPNSASVRKLFELLGSTTRDGLRVAELSALGAPETVVDVADFYNREGTSSEATAAITSTGTQKPEFTRAIAMAGNYPWLLRKLGLIFDLLVPYADVWNPESKTRVRVEAINPAMVQQRQISTACTINKASGAFTASFLDAPSALPDGMLPLAGVGFRVLQVDFDGAALKSIDFSRNLKRAADKTKLLPPSWRSAGLSVVQTGLLTEFNQSHATSVQWENSTTEIVVGAEHLIRGYHVSIEVDGKWFSACGRRFQYKLPGGSGKVDDFGWVTFDSVKEGSREYLHESLVLWGGWSLVAPKPGNPIKQDMPSSEPKVLLFDPATASVNISAEPGSLAMLRIGSTYRISMQSMDLCGGFLRPINPGKDAGGADHARLSAEASAPLLYKRYEPIEPPLFLPRFDLRKSPGQSAGHVVIHSGDSPESLSTAERHLAPPAIDPSLAETHGWLDTLGRFPAYRWIIESQDPLKVSGPKDAGPDGEKDTWYEEEHLAINYLPDGLAYGAAFHGLPQSTGTVVAEFGGSWPSMKALRLVVERGSRRPFWDALKRILTVTLEPATVYTIRISSALQKKNLDLLGMWAMQKQANFESSEERAEKGHYWALTPSREITLVHAVQRPLAAPTVELEIPTPSPAGRLPVIPRNWAETFVELKGSVKFHRRSSGVLGVRASWSDPVDARSATSPSSQLGMALQSGSAPLFENKIPYEGADTLEFPVPGSASTDAVSGRLNFSLLGHKRRTVTVYAQATSRFRDFFPFTDDAVEKNPDLVSAQTPASERRRVIVPSSLPPSALEITSIIPVFPWTKQTHEEKQHVTQVERTRTGGALRAYVSSEWLSSGENERLAAVMWSGAKAHYDAGASELPKELVPFVSQWGMDPHWRTQSVDTVLEPKHFVNRVNPSEFDAARFTVPHFEVDAGQKAYPTDRMMSIAAFEVQFNEERQLWWTDILVDGALSYFPFVRLALARFQDISVTHSVGGELRRSAHLSTVTLATFAQLTPKRTASILTDKKKRTIQVTVAGPVYDGHNPGPMDNTFVETTPAIEAYVEVQSRENPQGWIQLNGTNVSLTPTVSSGLCTWKGTIMMMDKIRHNKQRVVIREFESYTGDDVTGVTARRYTYAEALEI